MRTICCQECGRSAETNQRDARFCSDPCRRDFNNRRAKRGAELYDLMMAHNYDRSSRRLYGTWSLVYRLLSAYRDADNAKRNGRQSWRPVSDVVGSIPLAFGRDGDKR
jgi:hypothetical protein